MSSEQPRAWTCRRCGAENPAHQARCARCGEPAFGPRSVPAKPPAARIERREDVWADPLFAPDPALQSSRSGFPLTSLIAVIALIAILVGVARESPGMAILLLLIATPALLATTSRALSRRGQGRPMSESEKAVSFFGALAWTLLVLVALVVAFFLALVVLLAILCSGAFR